MRERILADDRFIERRFLADDVIGRTACAVDLRRVDARRDICKDIRTGPHGHDDFFQCGVTGTFA